MQAEKPKLLPAWVPTLSRLWGLLWSVKVTLAVGGLPKIALYFNGGLGDDIMCTAVAHELQKRGRRRIWLLTSFPGLFSGNTDFIPVPPDFRLRRLCGMFGIPNLELEYPLRHGPRHLMGTLCAEAGVQGDIDLRPYIVLTEAEKRAGKVTARFQIAIQSEDMAARFPHRNKQWGAERFQVVVDALKDEFDFVQVGMASDPKLDGALDLRGKTSVREVAGVLSASGLFVGLVSGLMHLARAVECRSVIVYGGREHPAQSGYTANENIYWEGACAPCWQGNHCDFERMCMSEISPDSVIAAVRRQAGRAGTKLTVDRTTI